MNSNQLSQITSKAG